MALKEYPLNHIEEVTMRGNDVQPLEITLPTFTTLRSQVMVKSRCSNRGAYCPILLIIAVIGIVAFCAIFKNVWTTIHAERLRSCIASMELPIGLHGTDTISAASDIKAEYCTAILDGVDNAFKAKGGRSGMKPQLTRNRLFVVKPLRDQEWEEVVRLWRILADDGGYQCAPLLNHMLALYVSTWISLEPTRMLMMDAMVPQFNSDHYDVKSAFEKAHLPISAGEKIGIANDALESLEELDVAKIHTSKAIRFLEDLSLTLHWLSAAKAFDYSLLMDVEERKKPRQPWGIVHDVSVIDFLSNTHMDEPGRLSGAFNLTGWYVWKFGAHLKPYKRSVSSSTLPSAYAYDLFRYMVELVDLGEAEIDGITSVLTSPGSKDYDEYRSLYLRMWQDGNTRRHGKCIKLDD